MVGSEVNERQNCSPFLILISRTSYLLLKEFLGKPSEDIFGKEEWGKENFLKQEKKSNNNQTLISSKEKRDRK